LMYQGVRFRANLLWADLGCEFRPVILKATHYSPTLFSLS
jgi:hypothetical protein